MSCAVWCDRVPFRVQLSIGEVEDLINKAKDHKFIWLDLLNSTDSQTQVALSIDKISAITPINM